MRCLIGATMALSCVSSLADERLQGVATAGHAAEPPPVTRLERAPTPLDAASGPSPAESARSGGAAGSPPGVPEEPFQAPLPEPTIVPKERARRYANWSSAACGKSIRQNKLPFAQDHRPTPGIAMAVRVRGSMGGVTFVTPPDSSRFGALDCRLALALADLAPILLEHEVTEVRIDNLYRPLSRRAKRPKPSQHTRGLAADITAFMLRDGHLLLVERDWQGEIGAPSCGPMSSLRERSDAAVRLRNLFCAVAARQLFDTLLTPNFDAAHRDHLHWDLRRGARSVIVR